VHINNQHLITMTSLNSRLQLTLLNRKKGRNLIEKGFTLVELMIVIVIVGVLSSVALPNFLGTRDKAAAGALIGSLQGFAKQCSTEQLTGGGSLTAAEVTKAGGTLSAVCTGAGTNPVTIKNTTAYTATRVTGLKCGRLATTGLPAVATATDTFCTYSIDNDGVITGAWSQT
jgi:type IV pilus assembly protein PilA